MKSPFIISFLLFFLCSYFLLYSFPLEIFYRSERSAVAAFCFFRFYARLVSYFSSLCFFLCVSAREVVSSSAAFMFEGRRRLVDVSGDGCRDQGRDEQGWNFAKRHNRAKLILFV